MWWIQLFYWRKGDFLQNLERVSQQKERRERKKIRETRKKRREGNFNFLYTTEVFHLLR